MKNVAKSRPLLQFRANKRRVGFSFGSVRRRLNFSVRNVLWQHWGEPKFKKVVGSVGIVLATSCSHQMEVWKHFWKVLNFGSVELECWECGSTTLFTPVQEEDYLLCIQLVA